MACMTSTCISMDEGPTSTSSGKSCAVCGAACSFTCARCKDVSYCGQTHQRLDWDTHKATCVTNANTNTNGSKLVSNKSGSLNKDELDGADASMQKCTPSSGDRNQFATVEALGLRGEELCAGTEEEMGYNRGFDESNTGTDADETSYYVEHSHEQAHIKSRNHNRKETQHTHAHTHPFIQAQDSGVYDLDQGIGFEDHVYLDPDVTIEKQLLNKMKEFVQDVEKRNGSTGSGHWNHLVEMFGTSLEHAPHPHHSGEVIEYEYEIGIGDLDGLPLDMDSDLGISMKEVQSSMGLSCVASTHTQSSTDAYSDSAHKHADAFMHHTGSDDFVHTYVVGHGVHSTGTADTDILIGDEGEIEEIAEVLLKSALRKDTHSAESHDTYTNENEYAFTSTDMEGVTGDSMDYVENNTKLQVQEDGVSASYTSNATAVEARTSTGRVARTYASAHRKSKTKTLSTSTNRSADGTQSTGTSGGMNNKMGVSGRENSSAHTRSQPYTHSRSGATHTQMSDSRIKNSNISANDDDEWEAERLDGDGSVRPFTSTREPAKSCAVCGKGCSSTCSRCRAVSYCGLLHQRQHWLTHKDACVAMTSNGGSGNNSSNNNNNTNDNNNNSSNNSNSNNHNNYNNNGYYNERDFVNDLGGCEIGNTGRRNLSGKPMSARRPGGYGPVYATDDRTGYGYPKGMSAPKWEFDYDWESILCVLFDSLGYRGPVASSQHTSIANPNKKTVTGVGTNISESLNLGGGRSIGTTDKSSADAVSGADCNSGPRLTCEAVRVARVQGADDDVYVRSIVPKPKTATVAARDIAAGELCLVEDPLLVVSSKDFVERHRGYRSLSTEQQQQFMSLFHPTPGTIEVQAYPTLKATETYIDARFAGLDRTDPRTDYDAVDDMIDKMKRVSFIIDMNGLRDAELASANGRHNAAHVYAHASRLKHSCAPNCCRAINSAGRVMVRALRPIPAGVELTVSYLDPTKRLCSGADRQELLRRLGYSCECIRCEAEFDDSFGFYCPNPKCGPPDGTSLGKLDYNHCNGLDVNPAFSKMNNTGTGSSSGSKGKGNKKKKPGKRNSANAGAKNGAAPRNIASGYGHVFLSHELDRLSPCAQCGTQPDQRYVERCASYQNQLATKLADLDTDCHKFEDDEPFVRTLQFCHTARMSQNRVVFVLHDMCVDWYTNMCEFGKAANYTLAQIRYLTRVCPLDPAVTAYALERLADCMAGCVRPQLYYDQARLRVCANHYPSSYLHANDLYPVRTPFLKAPDSEQVNQMYRLAIELLSYAYGSPDRQCVRDVCDKLAWFLANQ